MTPAFTPLSAICGGLLIAAAAVLRMVALGRITGISGIVSRLLPPYKDHDFGSRLAFLAGLMLAPLLVAMSGQPIPHVLSGDAGQLAIAGVLVGFGSVLGGGCTSGHGVCGMASLSARSLVATAVFMTAGIITVFVVRHGI